MMMMMISFFGTRLNLHECSTHKRVGFESRAFQLSFQCVSCFPFYPPITSTAAATPTTTKQQHQRHRQARRKIHRDNNGNLSSDVSIASQKSLQMMPFLITYLCFPSFLF